MNLGNFPILALASFFCIVFATPLISLFFLKREREANADILGHKSFVPGFLIGVLVWIAVVVVAGFALIMMLGMLVFVNAHVGARADASVPVIPLLMVFGMDAVLVFIGFLLHVRVSDKLWQSPKSQSNNLLLRSAG